NPVLGKSYGEIAADSRSQHKSQGFGVPRTRGEALEYFQPIAGEAPADNLFSGVTTGWSKVQGGAKIQASIESIISSFDFLQPQRSVPRLVALYKDISVLPAGFWKEIKLKEVQLLIEQASGLFIDAFTSQPFVAQTDSAQFNFSLNSRLANNILVKRISIAGSDTTLNTTLVSNRNLGFSRSFFVPASYPLTQPYWLQRPMSEGYFNVADPADIGKPDVDPAFTAQFHLDIEGQAFVFTKPVRYKFTDPVKGELYQPFVVLPRVTVNTAPSVVIVKQKAPVIFVTAKANKALNGENRVAAVNMGGRPLEKGLEGGGLQKGTGTEIEFAIPAASLKLQSTNAVPLIRHGSANGTDSLALSTIRYDHIPNINYFYTDAAKLLNIDLKTKGKKIGYIVGAGDKVPEALEAMGYDVTLVGEKEMARLSLQAFDAVISGVRAYNTADWLNTYHEKLMKYVADGGNLIVQYNTSNNNGPVRAKIGPLPFTISRNRVTDEGAAVTFLAPQHPALNYPNRITQDDFKGWIQERSIYGATEIAPQFQSILGMNDPGERSDSGSLIIAPHGKGYFTYTGLVFFRELPAGVPGAYRLLANLIALNQKREM
ncbi:MAG TPA: PIG-L family deacetylase, partial [Flavisolibacter sp.]